MARVVAKEPGYLSKECKLVAAGEEFECPVDKDGKPVKGKWYEPVKGKAEAKAEAVAKS